MREGWQQNDGRDEQGLREIAHRFLHVQGEVVWRRLVSRLRKPDRSNEDEVFRESNSAVRARHSRHQVHARCGMTKQVRRPHGPIGKPSKIDGFLREGRAVIQKSENGVSEDWIFSREGGAEERSHRRPFPPKPPLSQAQRNPCFDNGSDRTRVPDAAKMALATAGSTGGSDGSPRPVGGLFDFSQCTSITGGACAIRSSGTWWKLLCTAEPPL